MSEDKKVAPSKESWIEAARLREKLLLAGLLLSFAAACALIGFLVSNWIRYVGFGAGFVLASLAADIMLLLWPKTRVRELTRAVVGLPSEILMLLLRIAMALSAPLFIVTVLLAIVLASLTSVFGMFVEVEPLIWGLLYVGLVITVAIAAYSGDRLLLPLRWYLRIEGREVDKQLFKDAQVALRIINFRRFGYLLTIVAYSLSVWVDLTGIPVSQNVRPLLDTATAALLGFLAVDAYMSAFHQRVLVPGASLVFDSAPQRDTNTPMPASHSPREISQ